MIAALAATVAFTQLAPLPNPISTARYLGGGLRFRSQFEWKESAEQGEAWVFAGSCANECQGEKHFVHSSCDLSCDVRCKQGTHTESASANYGGSSTFYPNVMLGRLKGVIAPSETEALFGEANEQALRLVRAIKLPLKIPCWNETPCSYSARFIGARRFELRYTYWIEREIRDAAGALSIEQVKAETGVYWYVSVPETGRSKTDNREMCKCNVVHAREGGDEDDEDYFVQPPPTTEPKRPQTGGDPPPTPPGGGGAAEPEGNDEVGLYDEPPPTFNWTGFYVGLNTGVRWGQDEEAPLCHPALVDRFRLTPVLEDMNRGVISAFNPFRRATYLFLPAGTLFDTDNDGVQDMVLVSDVLLELPPNIATRGPSEQKNEVVKPIRVMCLEMDKLEPSPNVRYRVKPNHDPVAAQLAKLTSKARMRGPYDQMRLWIHTDASTYKHIQEKLLPTPSPGQYVRALKETAESGTDIEHKRFARCFDPALLAEPIDLRATIWFTRQVVRRDARGLAQWASKEGGRLAQLLAPEVGADGPRQVARILNILSTAPHLDAQKAALSILERIPAARRAALREQGIASVWRLAWSPDKAIAAQARKLLDAYDPPEKELIILNIPK